MVLAVGTVSIYVARARDVRERRLRRVTQIAQAAQRAVQRAVPTQVGEVAFAARYLSAYETAEVGGDFYEVTATPFGVRAIVGDVCGKGLDGVRLAATLTGAFRESVFAHRDPPQAPAVATVVCWPGCEAVCAAGCAADEQAQQSSAARSAKREHIMAPSIPSRSGNALTYRGGPACRQSRTP